MIGKYGVIVDVTYGNGNQSNVTVGSTYVGVAVGSGGKGLTSNSDERHGTRWNCRSQPIAQQMSGDDADSRRAMSRASRMSFMCPPCRPTIHNLA